MITLKLKDIKESIAEDVTSNQLPEHSNRWETIGVSHGIYGMNGALFRDPITGKKYKIIKRSTNLFRLV